MLWRITNNELYEVNGHIICTFSPDIDPFYLRLIKKTPEIISLVFKFREFYTAGKKITKKLHDNLRDLIEENQNYNFSWDIDKDCDLIDNAKIKICRFLDKDSADAVHIRFVPEILKAIKDNISPFTSSNANQKPLNQSLIKVLKKIDEY